MGSRELKESAFSHSCPNERKELYPLFTRTRYQLQSMSSLIFYTDETQVLVATDTLATYPDGRPFKFVTKPFIVPHLKLIMAGVGTSGFLARWFVFMNESVIVKGIDNLNYHTPRALRMLWKLHKQELSIPDGLTTT